MFCRTYEVAWLGHGKLILLLSFLFFSIQVHLQSIICFLKLNLFLADLMSILRLPVLECCDLLEQLILFGDYLSLFSFLVFKLQPVFSLGFSKLCLRHLISIALFIEVVLCELHRFFDLVELVASLHLVPLIIHYLLHQGLEWDKSVLDVIGLSTEQVTHHWLAKLLLLLTNFLLVLHQSLNLHLLIFLFRVILTKASLELVLQLLLLTNLKDLILVALQVVFKFVISLVEIVFLHILTLNGLPQFWV